MSDLFANVNTQIIFIPKSTGKQWGTNLTRVAFLQVIRQSLVNTVETS